MKLKSFLGAAAVALTAAFIGAAPAQAITVSDNGLLEGGIDSNSISVGDIFQIEIFGDAADTGGSVVWKFAATEALVTIETNSLNPVSGFAGATVQWNSQADGNGTSFGSISGLDLIMGKALVTQFAANELKYLIASWTDVTADKSNFDLRIDTQVVPLPASVFLLLAALGGLGVVSRRRPATA
jgi:hypothetical protein